MIALDIDFGNETGRLFVKSNRFSTGTFTIKDIVGRTYQLHMGAFGEEITEIVNIKIEDLENGHYPQYSDENT